MQIFSSVTGLLATRLMDNLANLIAFSLFVIVADGYFIRQYINDNRRLKTARTGWPKVTGHVTSTRWHEGRGYQSVGHPVVGTSYGMVTYSYEVGSKSYKKTAYLTTDRDELAAVYPKNAEVTVFYDPRKPEDGLWEKDVERTRSGLGFLVFMNLLFLFFGILIIVIYP